MGFLKKLLTKKKHEITPKEMEKVESLISSKTSYEGDDEIIEVKEINGKQIVEKTSNEKINYEDSQTQGVSDGLEISDFLKILKNIKSSDINKIRNFLDRKEKEFNLNNSNQKLKSKETEILVEGVSEPKSIGEIYVEDHITEKDLDNKTYSNKEETNTKEISKSSDGKEYTKENVEKITPITPKNDSNENEQDSMSAVTPEDRSGHIEEDSMSFQKIDKEEYSEVKIEDLFDKKSSPKNQSPNDRALEMYEEVKRIFKEENVIFKEDKKSTYENLNFRKLYFIGIRKKDEFKNDIAHWAEQNRWFVNNIKKLNELQQFKVLESKEGFKDLLFDIGGENSIILSFRTVDKLKDEDSFDLPILEE